VKPNWFIAFPVLGDFVRQLPAPPMGFRLFDARDVHLTLSFLGGCSPQAASFAMDAVKNAMQQVAVAPIQISLGQVAPMGPRGRYSALSALLVEGRAAIESCLLEFRDRASDAAGVRRDARDPKPHVTVARPSPNATPEQRALGLSWARELDLTHVRCTLDRVALYTWHTPRRERLFAITDEQLLG
jgi:2'-5' RNA ligase